MQIYVASPWLRFIAKICMVYKVSAEVNVE